MRKVYHDGVKEPPTASPFARLRRGSEDRSWSYELTPEARR